MQLDYVCGVQWGVTMSAHEGMCDHVHWGVTLSLREGVYVRHIFMGIFANFAVANSVMATPIKAH